jgi:hypothetical protein
MGRARSGTIQIEPRMNTDKHRALTLQPQHTETKRTSGTGHGIAEYFNRRERRDRKEAESSLRSLRSLRLECGVVRCSFVKLVSSLSLSVVTAKAAPCSSVVFNCMITGQGFTFSRAVGPQPKGDRGSAGASPHRVTEIEPMRMWATGTKPARWRVLREATLVGLQRAHGMAPSL